MWQDDVFSKCLLDGVLKIEERNEVDFPDLKQYFLLVSKLFVCYFEEPQKSRLDNIFK